MSSSLWYKAGRSCISPMPTLISVQSVPDEDSAQQQESGYSSLHGYVDYEPRCQSTQARSSFCNTFDSCEGKPSYCLCFETVPLGILFCYKRKWYASFYFVISRWRWEFAQETFIGKVSVEFWGARGEKDLYEVFLDLNKELKPQTESRSEQLSSLSFLLTLTFLLLSIISTVEMIIYLGGTTVLACKMFPSFFCPWLKNIACLSSLMIRRQQGCHSGESTCRCVGVDIIYKWIEHRVLWFSYLIKSQHFDLVWFISNLINFNKVQHTVKTCVWAALVDKPYPYISSMILWKNK